MDQACLGQSTHATHRYRGQTQSTAIQSTAFPSDKARHASFVHKSRIIQCKITALTISRNTHVLLCKTRSSSLPRWLHWLNSIQVVNGLKLSIKPWQFIFLLLLLSEDRSM